MSMPSLGVPPHAVAALRTRTFMFAALLSSVLFVVNLVVSPKFVTSGGLTETLADLAPFAIIAMASVPSVVTGGLDLSLGPVLSLSNVMLVGVLLPHGLGDAEVAIPLLLALGAVVGAISGVLIAYLRVPAVIAGLCALFVVVGVDQQILLDPTPAPANWTDHLAGKIGPVPGGLISMAVPLVVWLLLKRTPFVRAMFSTGGDVVAAYTAGMDVRGVTIIAYALGGMLAAAAGFALTGLIHSADSSLGVQYALIAVAAVSLGGTPIGGGRGGLVGALLGAVCIFLVQNLLFALNIPAEWLDVVYGAVLIVAVIVASLIAPRPFAVTQ